MSTHQKTAPQSFAEQSQHGAIISAETEKADFKKIANTLLEIRKLEGITGYILRNDTFAVVDLVENTKLCDYALFGWQLHESSVEIAKQFNLANIENMIFEGKNLKALCINVGDCRVDVFMEKTTEHTSILKLIML